MRESITGYVGESSFEEALGLIAQGPTRGTLFVHNGSSEKVFHFSEETVAFLELSGQENPALTELRSLPPTESGYRDSAGQFLRSELLEVSTWKGALFEYLVGPAVSTFASREGVLTLQAEPALLLQGLDVKQVLGPSSKKASSEQSATCFSRDQEPSTRVEKISALVLGAVSKQLLLRELSSAWEELGSARHAATTLKDAAQHYLQWRTPEHACKTLERVLELSPLETSAAEQLLLLHQAAGRRKQAERVAELTCAELDKLRLPDLVLHFYRLLERPADSVELRRIAAEAMIRTGDFATSLKELKFLGRVFESQGNVEEAVSVYERVLEIEPRDSTTKQKLRKARGKGRFTRRLRRCAALLAAGVLLVLWFGWDVSSAVAIGNVKASGMSLPSREAVALLHEGMNRYPVSGHAGRLASLEEEFYQLSFEESKKLIRAALKAEKAGDLATADDLFERVFEETLLSPLVARAETGRAEIESRRTRTDELITSAADLFRSGDFKAAFGVYRQILLGAHDTVLASSYSVPVLVETLPQGARIKLDGKTMGRTPRWILLPSDPASELTLSHQGFQSVSMSGVLQPMLDANDHRLRVTLEPRILWAAERVGGEIATGDSLDARIIAVLGADGVLRGLDPFVGRTRWEAPLDRDFRSVRLEQAAGPAVLLSTAPGRILAFSLASGRYAWTARVSPKRDGVLVGPVYRGQLLVTSTQRTVLLNPQTGLVARQIDVPAGRPVKNVSVAGDRGLIELSGGDLVVADLRTGRREVVRERFLHNAVRTVVRGRALLVLRENGTLEAYSPPAEEQLWETQIGAQYSLVCENNATSVCVGSATGAIVCVDTRDGMSVWKTSVDGKLNALSGSKDGQTIVAHVERDGETVVNGFSAQTGDALWGYRTGPSEASSACVAEKRVLISSPSCGVVSLELVE